MHLYKRGESDVIGRRSNDFSSLRTEGELVSNFCVCLVVGVSVVRLNVETIDVPSIGIRLVKDNGRI